MVGSSDQFLLQPAHLVLKASVVSLQVLRLHLQVVMVFVQVLLILVMCVIVPFPLMMPTLGTLVIILSINYPPPSSSVFTWCLSLSSTLNSNTLLTNSSLQWSRILLVCSSLGATATVMWRWGEIVFLLCLLHHPVRRPPLVVFLLLQLLLHLPILLQ